MKNITRSKFIRAYSVIRRLVRRSFMQSRKPIIQQRTRLIKEGKARGHLLSARAGLKRETSLVCPCIAKILVRARHSLGKGWGKQYLCISFLNGKYNNKKLAKYKKHVINFLVLQHFENVYFISLYVRLNEISYKLS